MSVTVAPPPLTPPEADLQDFPFMPLHVSRLRDSDLAAEEAPEACWYAVMLWAASWHQLPAGSLPDNDTVLARLAGLGRDARTWKRHRDGALRGFVLCDDGRLYHPVIAEQVATAWKEKLAYRARKVKRKEIASNAANARWHSADGADVDADAMHGAFGGDAPSIADVMPKGTGRGTGTGNYSDDGERELDPDPDKSPKPAAEWPPAGDPGKGLAGDLARVLDAAGIPIDPSHRRWADELQRLKGWLAKGLDLETEILPAVDRALRRLPADDTMTTLQPVGRELMGGRAKARVAQPAATPAAPPTFAKPGEDTAVTRWRERVHGIIGGAAYRHWLDPVAAGVDDDVLTITAPTGFHASRIEAEYRFPIERAAGEIFGAAVVRFATA